MRDRDIIPPCPTQPHKGCGWRHGGGTKVQLRSNTSNSFIKIIDEVLLNTTGFISILKYCAIYFDNTIELRNFIEGYNGAYFLCEVKDIEYQIYLKNKPDRTLDSVVTR